MFCSVIFQQRLVISLPDFPLWCPRGFFFYYFSRTLVYRIVLFFSHVFRIVIFLQRLVITLHYFLLCFPNFLKNLCFLCAISRISEGSTLVCCRRYPWIHGLRPRKLNISVAVTPSMLPPMSMEPWAAIKKVLH